MNAITIKLIKTNLLLIGFLACFKISAQDFSYQVTYTKVDTIINGVKLESMFKVECLILYRTSGINKAHVMVGTVLGGANIFQYAFVLNNSNNLPSGLSCEVMPTSIKLGLGIMEIANKFHYEVRLEDVQGKFTKAITLVK